MIIKRIKLEQFTVFENQQIDFIPGINVLVGENGTGKTHLLKVLLCMPMCQQKGLFLAQARFDHASRRL